MREYKIVQFMKCMSQVVTRRGDKGRGVTVTLMTEFRLKRWLLNEVQNVINDKPNKFHTFSAMYINLIFIIWTRVKIHVYTL